MPTSEQLLNVFDNKLGLRAGKTTDGAAYGMSDFGEGSPLEIMKWIANPSSDPERTKKWNDHLYNSVWKIDDLTKGFNLLIVDKAHPSGERYDAPGGIGDKKTFAKCNKLPPDSKIIAEKYFDEGAIDEAVEWVLANI